MSEPRFRPVGAAMPHAEIESRIRDWWKRERIFERTVEERPAGDLYSFYEGPPTANGEPGVHHVLARAFKDLFPRYQTMRGRRAPRKGGWDTHGLPVELEVERELGLASKSEIEQFGIAAFNGRCRESVMKYVAQWEELTERIAFWIDTEDAYRTYAPDYIESCWWIFKTLWDRGLIYEARRTTPHCPRCETSLSSHEVAQGYAEDTPDPSIWIRFRAQDGSLPAALRHDGPTDLLAWTTTPWTLPANSGLAVAPEESYAAAQLPDGSRLLLAERLVEAALGEVEGAEEARIVARLPGAELEGITYEGLYEPEQWGNRAWRFEGARLVEWDDGEPPPRRVVSADFVSMEEGSGIVHIAPAFGEDDYLLGRDQGLLFRQPVDLRGVITGDPAVGPSFVGKWVKDADDEVIADLERRGRLLRRHTIRHTYPFCWRCDTPLLYYAKPSWYIATSRLRDSLLDSNENLIHWHPEHIRRGRYGDWLSNNVDWAISRERYWGTPLPFWRCEACGNTDCVGSFEELRSRAVGDPPDLSDPHRPAVDAVRIRCEACGGEARRVPEVADAWFDSGAMPYAQWHYPFENRARFDERFPAEFICEAVDQTRGWFYSLHAEAVLLHAAGAVPVPTSYRHVLSLGHILDEDGEKMSKSRGNVVDPWSVLDAHGADALRWYCYVAAPAGNPRRFSQRLVGEAQRRFLLTLWNTYAFFATYAEIDGWTPEDAPPATGSDDLDRWIRSELQLLIRSVGGALDEYDATAAARRLEAFVDSLSNWWVRRSRRRFWSAARGGDRGAQAKNDAHATLHEALTTLARLLAPMTPYVAEEIWRNLASETDLAAAPSVHLARWPEADEDAIDEALNAEMAFVQRAVSLGRAARSSAGIKVRQPLASAAISASSPADAAAIARHADMIAAELNVKRVEAGDAALPAARYSIKPNLRVLGPRLGPRLPALRTALASLAPELAQHIAQAVEDRQSIEIEGIALRAGDLLIERAAAAGDGASASDDGCSVSLDPEIDQALAREGMAREVIHRVQNLRRDSGLDPADRIHLRLSTADAELAAALADHERLIAAETLAASAGINAGPAPAHAETAEIDGAALALSLERA